MNKEIDQTNWSDKRKTDYAIMCEREARYAANLIKHRDFVKEYKAMIYNFWNNWGSISRKTKNEWQKKYNELIYEKYE